jgi:hypothetical protein
MCYDKHESIFDPQRWGLRDEITQNLVPRFVGFWLWLQFQECFKTKTRDTSDYAYSYMSGLLRMEGKRNFTNIGFNTGVPEQNMRCSPLIVGVFIRFLFIFYRHCDNNKMSEQYKKNEDLNGKITIRHVPIQIAMFME